MADYLPIGEVIMWPLRIAIVAAIFGGFYLVEAKALSSLEDIYYEEANQLSSRFLYNSNCLMKSGYVGKEYYSHNIIDPDKLDADHLLMCNSRKGFSAGLVLEYGNHRKETIVEAQAGDFRIDSDSCFDNERFFCVFNKHYVLVYDNGILVPGYLSINGVLRKNV